MNADMKLYYDYTVSPLGLVFYNTVWRQLEHIEQKSILDFGSGFGFTSNALAKRNTVVAVEKDAQMIDAAVKEHTYTHIHGDITTLQTFETASFDVVICHLVLEFVDNPQEILQGLLRILKKNGIISLVRHNRAGRIVQALVQEADFAETEKVMQGGFAYSSAFGDIKYFDDTQLLQWANESVYIEAKYGVRALASLHNAHLQAQEEWYENMFRIEWELLKQQPFIDIAYFNHLILKKLD